MLVCVYLLLRVLAFLPLCPGENICIYCVSLFPLWIPNEHRTWSVCVWVYAGISSPFIFYRSWLWQLWLLIWNDPKSDTEQPFEINSSLHYSDSGLWYGFAFFLSCYCCWCRKLQRTHFSLVSTVGVTHATQNDKFVATRFANKNWNTHQGENQSSIPKTGCSRKPDSCCFRSA